MKRTRTVTVGLLLVFALITASLALTSCKGPMSDEQAREILAPLFEKEIIINRFVYGDGFETEKDPGDDKELSYSKYYVVKENNTFKSCEEIRSAIKALYCGDTLTNVLAFALDGTDDARARFATSVKTDENEAGILQIDVTNDGYSPRGVIYPDTAVVKKSSDSSATINVKFYNGKVTRNKTVEIKLIDGVWYLASNTWAVETKTGTP